MNKLLADSHFELTNGDKILAINKLAVEKEKKGVPVINATIGMLFDEEGKLATFEAVDELIAVSNDELTKRYGPVNGGKSFEQAVLKWLFEDVDLHEAKVHAIMTNGATGALSISMRNYLEMGQEILLPDIRWSSYDNIAHQVHAGRRSYHMFKDGHLDVEDIKKQVKYSLDKYHRVFLLINDPCQNPTGYTLSLDEWKEILECLKEASQVGPVVLLDDIAYMNYSEEDYSKVFSLMASYVSDNLMIHITFSASKTLQIYGLRGGALVALTSNEEELTRFAASCEGTARAIWSMPNNVASKVIRECFNSDDHRLMIKGKLLDYTQMLKERAEAFFDEASKFNITTHPYKNGFFVLVPCKKPDEVSNFLIKEDIYMVPMGEGLRISLASIRLNQVRRLVQELGKAMKEVL